MSTERKWRVVGIGQEDDQYLSVSGVNHERKRMYHTASEEEAKQQVLAAINVPLQQQTQSFISVL